LQVAIKRRKTRLDIRFRRKILKRAAGFQNRYVPLVEPEFDEPSRERFDVVFGKRQIERVGVIVRRDQKRLANARFRQLVPR